jgi:hypothetical protein
MLTNCLETAHTTAVSLKRYSCSFRPLHALSLNAGTFDPARVLALQPEGERRILNEGICRCMIVYPRAAIPQPRCGHRRVGTSDMSWRSSSARSRGQNVGLSLTAHSRLKVRVTEADVEKGKSPILAKRVTLSPRIELGAGANR